MKIPKSIKIGGHVWEIKYPYTFQERSDRWGQCDDAKKQVLVSDSDVNGAPRAKSSVMITFIHEILHALDFFTGQKIFDGESGEMKAAGLSEAIFQVLVDNQYIKVE